MLLCRNHSALQQHARPFDSVRDAGCPDASRGYDVEEYAGLWRQLNERQWPQQTTVAVVGPIGDAFAAAAVACAHDVVGPNATAVTSEHRSRWQSVRLQVVCTSADDFCVLHSRLSALEGAKAVF